MLTTCFSLQTVEAVAFLGSLKESGDAQINYSTFLSRVIIPGPKQGVARGDWPEPPAESQSYHGAGVPSLPSRKGCDLGKCVKDYGTKARGRFQGETIRRQ